MIPVVGDSFGDASRQFAGQQALYQAMAERGYQHMLAQQDFARQQEQFNREMALRQATVMQNQALAQQEMALRQRLAAQNYAQQQQQNEIARQYAGAYQQQVQHALNAPTPAEERDITDRRRYAEALASTGGFLKPDPTLTPADNALFMSISDQYNAQHDLKRKTAEGLADMLNRKTYLESRVADLTKQVQETRPFSTGKLAGAIFAPWAGGLNYLGKSYMQNAAAKDELDKATAELQLLTRQANAVQQDPTLRGMVAPLPGNAGWGPAVSLSPRAQALRQATPITGTETNFGFMPGSELNQPNAIARQTAQPATVPQTSTSVPLPLPESIGGTSSLSPMMGTRALNLPTALVPQPTVPVTATTPWSGMTNVPTYQLPPTVALPAPVPTALRYPSSFYQRVNQLGDQFMAQGMDRANALINAKAQALRDLQTGQLQPAGAP